MSNPNDVPRLKLPSDQRQASALRRGLLRFARVSTIATGAAAIVTGEMSDWWKLLLQGLLAGVAALMDKLLRDVLTKNDG